MNLTLYGSNRYSVIIFTLEIKGQEKPGSYFAFQDDDTRVFSLCAPSELFPGLQVGRSFQLARGTDVLLYKVSINRTSGQGYARDSSSQARAYNNTEDE